MQDKDELIRCANIGKRVGAFLDTDAVCSAYQQSLDAWRDQLCACDPHDRTTMVMLKGMREGLMAFWGALKGLQQIGEDAQRQLIGRVADDDEQTGRIIK